MAENNLTARRGQPAVRVPEKIEVLMPQAVKAPNGVPIYALNIPEQPVIRVSIVFRAGTSLRGAPFSASATANLLAEGSRLHDARHIAERLDYFGSYYDVSIDRDYSVVTFASLSKFFKKTLEVLREILTMPAFPESEVSVYAAKHRQRLSLERRKVSFRARELFAGSLFGPSHPYGISYQEYLYEELNRFILDDFYKKHYTAGNCFIVASGLVGDAETAILQDFACCLQAGGQIVPDPFPAAHSRPLCFEGHDGAVQSAIRIGRLFHPRTHPDYIPMQVVTAILGGYFGSRLVQNLREERGYTYGVFAGMVNMEYEGYVAVATEVARDATVDSITQIYLEMERLATEKVSDGELQIVKNIMTGEVMRILDGPFGIADVTIENIQNGTDNTYLDRFLAQVRDITPETVLDIARKYLDPESYTTVIVGDPVLEKYFNSGAA
ncbi:MAG: insulinase family protein [Alistipes sp.]|nr:insulinase family protein [Alistipes sp.]